MSRHANLVNLAHLELEIRIDPLFGEHPATRQVITILVERFLGLFQAGADGRDLGFFFRWQIV